MIKKQKNFQEQVEELIANGSAAIATPGIPYHSILPIHPCPTCGHCPTCGRPNIIPMTPTPWIHQYQTSVPRVGVLC